MIQVTPINPVREILPEGVMSAWREQLPKVTAQLPVEVQSFIDGIAAKLPEFGRIRNEQVQWMGWELKLAGITHIKGVAVINHRPYPVDVPYLSAVDHRITLMRLYQKKGKQALIDFCKNKTKGTELSKLLDILNVHVFHIERPEFQKVMSDINQAEKVHEQSL